MSRPTPVNLADMAAQLSRMSQLAINVDNLKVRNALLESELLRARQVLRNLCCIIWLPCFRELQRAHVRGHWAVWRAIDCSERLAGCGVQHATLLCVV